METPTLPMLATALFLGPMLVAAWFDFMTFRIPNAIPLISVLSFLAVGLLSGGIDYPWSEHVLGGACGLAIGLAAFALRAMGGGDGKLLAAAALWAGFPHLMALLVMISLAGGILAVSLVMLRRENLAMALSLTRLDLPVLRKSAPIPYGVAIAGGCLWLALGSV